MQDPASAAAHDRDTVRHQELHPSRPSLRAATMRRQSDAIRWVGGRVELLLLLSLLVLEAFTGAVDEHQRAAGGSLLNRVPLIGLFVVSIPLLVHHAKSTAILAGRCWPLLALSLWFLLTAAWADYPDLTLRRGMAHLLVVPIALAIAVSFERPADFLRPLYWAFAIICAANVLAALLFPPLVPEMGANGIYSNKNTAGSVALLMIVVFTLSCRSFSGALGRAGAVGMIAVAWGFLIATNSKTCIGAAALLSASLPVFAFALRQPKAYKLAIATGCLFLLGAALFLFEVNNTSLMQEASEAGGDLTLTKRTELWQVLLPEIEDRLWTGHGFGSFWDTGQTLNPIRSTMRNDDWFLAASIINSAHNGFVDVPLQAGLVGLLLELVILRRCFWNLCLVIPPRRTDPKDRGACMALLGMMAALLVNNFTESLLFQPAEVLGYVFILVAVQAERWRWEFDRSAALGARGREAVGGPRAGRTPWETGWRPPQAAFRLTGRCSLITRPARRLRPDRADSRLAAERRG